MKLSIFNKKNNHKPNLQYANQGVILLLLVARADDQWRMRGGCLLPPFRPLFVPSKNNISRCGCLLKKSPCSTLKKKPSFSLLPVPFLYGILTLYGIFYFLFPSNARGWPPLKKSCLLLFLCLIYMVTHPFCGILYLFPFLMRVNGLSSMESTTVNMECMTTCVRGFWFCLPKESLTQPRYFLIHCIFPSL